MDVHSLYIFYHLDILYYVALKICCEISSDLEKSLDMIFKWLIIIHLMNISSVNHCSVVWPFSLSLLICKMGI